MKAIILKYDAERHDYIMEDLGDDRFLVVKENKLQELKVRLSKVSNSSCRRCYCCTALPYVLAVHYC